MTSGGCISLSGHLMRLPFRLKEILMTGKIPATNYYHVGIKAVYGKGSFLVSHLAKYINTILSVSRVLKQTKAIPLQTSGSKDQERHPSPGICITNGKMRNG